MYVAKEGLCEVGKGRVGEGEKGLVCCFNKLFQLV